MQTLSSCGGAVRWPSVPGPPPRRERPSSFVRCRLTAVWDRASSGKPSSPISANYGSDRSGGYRIVSPHDAAYQGTIEDLIREADYPLHHRPDRNFLLEFAMPKRKTLLIPCMEFFVRCYGRSMEVQRILATYPWAEAERRLYRPPDQPPEPEEWPIKLAPGMHNDDAVFLAHVRYDPHARNAARSIYAQIEAAYQSSGRWVFLRVEPWFRGRAKLAVAGLPVNGGRTFLGLRILGCSQPRGPTILRDREDRGLAGEPETTDGRSENPSGPALRSSRPPGSLDLTDADDPDRSSAVVEIEEEEFQLLGEPRGVVDVWQARDSASIRVRRGLANEASLLSTGDPHGSGKGVGKADLHSLTVVMDSGGVLRDMWNAALRLREVHPDAVSAVEWFTFADGFRTDPEPKLISIEPFDQENRAIDAETRAWVYCSPKARIPRGVLVIRIVVSGRCVYLVEIQRRTIRRRGEDGEPVEKEEPLKGLVFVLDDERNLEEWVRLFLNQVRHVKGVVERLTGHCPGVAHVFKHSTAASEQVPCEAAIRNALKKVGFEA